MGSDSGRKTTWRRGVGACWLALAGIVTLPWGVAGQDGMTVAVAPVLAHRLDRSGGARVGFEAQWFAATRARHSWGLAVAYQPLGRFNDPVPGDYYDESIAALGARIRWGPGAGRGLFTTLGVDVLSVTNEDPDTMGRDPAVGGFAGVGYYLTPGSSSPRLFVESGMHALAATGELTAGSGVYGTFSLGVAF